MSVRLHLKGVLAALITPVKQSGEPDLDAMRRLAEHLVAAGLNGLCPVGSTGEGPHLSRAQRLRVVEATMAAVAGRLPVIPAVAAPSMQDALAELDDYARLSCDAALVAPGFYYPLAPAAVERYFRDLAARTPLPILLYNIPQMTKVTIEPALAARLASETQIIGIKDSSRDYEYFCQLVESTSDEHGWSVLTGTDTMLAACMLAGGSGAIAASANLVPHLGLAVYQAAAAGDWPTAMEAQRRLVSVVLACRVGSFPAGWKAALSLAGLCEPWTVPPTPALTEDQINTLRMEVGEQSLETGRPGNNP